MREYFLLRSDLAVKLYTDCARALPIIDFHNHLSVSDIVSDRVFDNITQLWIETDPYKHRAMRILGIPERYITGDASHWEKFEVWYSCIPRLAGNPLYDWCEMEFQTVFGITLPPFRADAGKVWDAVNEQLKDLSAKRILAKFPIEYSAPCTSLCDDLTPFSKLEGICPFLRGDDIVAVNRDFVKSLEAAADMTVSNFRDFEIAIEKRVAQFVRHGCKYADHALDDGFRYVPEDGKNPQRFQALLAGQTPGSADREALASGILRILGRLYAKHGLTMQLHIGAKRHTSARLLSIAGPAGGYAAIGGGVDVRSLTALLDDIEQAGKLPKTVLFTLNPADSPVMSALSGSYSADGVQALVSQGPAWWWCDHYQGICDTLDNLSAYGVLSTFLGMTTDSRSLLSFVRHDYFRRILCQWMADKVEQERLPADFDILSDIVKRVCYLNAKNSIQ